MARLYHNELNFAIIHQYGWRKEVTGNSKESIKPLKSPTERSGHRL